MKNIERTKDKNIDKILFTRNFYLICIANLCTCMAIYSVMPVLPLYLIDVLHCKESVMGIGLAAFPLIALAVRPFSGMISDMMDCKRLLLIATTCCAIFFPLTYMAATISIFICIRLLHGVSFSIMTTSQATMAVGFIPEKKLGMGIGVFSSMLSLGMILGPMLGLYVTSRFSYAAAFGLPFIFTGFSAVERLTGAKQKNHPLCWWRQYVIHTKTLFRYDEVVQAHRNFNGKVFLLWKLRLII